MAAKKPPQKVIEKPFLKGSATDETTVRQSLKFLGILAITSLMTFLVCSLTSFKSDVLRILINIVIEMLILIIFLTEVPHREQMLLQEVRFFISILKRELMSPRERREFLFIQLKDILLVVLDLYCFSFLLSFLRLLPSVR